MSNNKVAVISLGTEDYEKGRLRLAQTLSVMDNYAGDFFLFENESECNSPIHRRNPYAFKIYAIEKVRDMGYNQILWLDCSVYVIKSIVPIFDKISED
jgi:hypothetical protein